MLNPEQAAEVLLFLAQQPSIASVEVPPEADRRPPLDTP
jgi:hypothetical protein